MAEFIDQFDQQKIPIWYKHYIDYHVLHEYIEEFQGKENLNEFCKLPGIYYYSMTLMKPVCLSFDLLKKEESKQ